METDGHFPVEDVPVVSVFLFTRVTGLNDSFLSLSLSDEFPMQISKEIGRLRSPEVDTRVVIRSRP